MAPPWILTLSSGQPVFLQHIQGLGGEGFIELDEVDVVSAHSPPSREPSRWPGWDPCPCAVQSTPATARETIRARTVRSVLVGEVLATDDQCRGSDGDGTGGRGGDGALLQEGRARDLIFSKIGLPAGPHRDRWSHPALSIGDHFVGEDAFRLPGLQVPVRATGPRIPPDGRVRSPDPWPGSRPSRPCRCSSPSRPAWDGKRG